MTITVVQSGTSSGSAAANSNFYVNLPSATTPGNYYVVVANITNSSTGNAPPCFLSGNFGWDHAAYTTNPTGSATDSIVMLVMAKVNGSGSYAILQPDAACQISAVALEITGETVGWVGQAPSTVSTIANSTSNTAPSEPWFANDDGSGTHALAIDFVGLTGWATAPTGFAVTNGFSAPLSAVGATPGSSAGSWAPGVAVSWKTADAPTGSVGDTANTWTNSVSHSVAGVFFVTSTPPPPAYTGGWQYPGVLGDSVAYDAGPYTGPWPVPDPGPPDPGAADAYEIDWYICLPNPAGGNLSRVDDTTYDTWVTNEWWQGGTYGSQTYGQGAATDPGTTEPAGQHLYINWQPQSNDANGYPLQPSIDAPSLVPSGWAAPPPPPTPTGQPDTVSSTSKVVFQFAGDPDDVTSWTDITVNGYAIGKIGGTPDLVLSISAAKLRYVPDLQDITPIEIGFEMHGEMVLFDPADPDPDPPEQALDDPLDTLAARYGAAPTGLHGWRRVQPIVVASMPTPIIADGKPVVPVYWANSDSSVSLSRGFPHIRSVDPNPKEDGSPNDEPPPDGPPWDGRWMVDDLPDPPQDGYYWLGDPSSQDGTGGYGKAYSGWAPHPSTPGAPTWHSFYPYKPSVRAFDAFLPDGNVVHHPKGVHFNPEFVEHMWCDFGGPRHQPFSWVIAGMIASYPSLHYRHYILDAGSNPDRVNFPRQSPSSIADGKKIKDGLDYRTAITYSPQSQIMSTSENIFGPQHIHARTHANIRPKMFFGVFNGGSSMTGCYGPGSRILRHGRVSNQRQPHRRYVLGRSQGFIDPDKASHMMIFEIRFWRKALTADHLENHYKQLSSTYHFEQYRSNK